MTNLARKRLALIVAVVAIAILSVAAFTQFGGINNSPVGSGTTNSTSTTSLTLPISTSSTSSGGSAPLYMALGQSNPALVATPSATMNYTVVVSQLDTGASHVTLSAMSRVPGVTLAVTPNQFTFLGAQGAVRLGISVAPTVNSSTLPVEIMATTVSGTASLTLDFRLNKALIVLPGVALKLPILHVSAGQTVTWLDLVQIDDDGLGFANITLGDRSAASPTLVQFDTWSHKFDKPGEYPYGVVVYQIPLAGVVVVE